MDSGQEWVPGTRVAGRYRIEGLLGKGGMGSVWRAVDETLDREVAIKRVLLEAESGAGRSDARERVLREARIAARLHHSHIVGIFDIVEQDEPWLILEYVPSRSLAAILAERRTLPPGEVAAIGAQIAAALVAAHQVRVVHRDIKPANVLVAEQGQNLVVKLTDFGIARTLDAPTTTTTGLLRGTPAYFAPETARGDGTDARADIYSLGATLYAAVEGHPPFGGADPNNVLALVTRIGRGGAPPPQHAGPLTELLWRLLHDDPDQRPTAAQAEAALWEIAASGTAWRTPSTPSAAPTLVGPPPPAPRGPGGFPQQTPPQPKRQSPWPWVALTVAAAVTGALIFVGVNLSAPEAPAAPPAPPVAEQRPLAIGDPMTADACSLADLPALSRYGSPRVDRANGRYGACRVDMGSNLSLFLNFKTEAEKSTSTNGVPQTIGSLVVSKFPDDGLTCYREVPLPDGNLVEVWSQRYGDKYQVDLCEVADVGTTGAINLLLARGVGITGPLAAERPLAQVDACGLIQSADLAGIPGLDPAGRRGFGGWRCYWWKDQASVVEMQFMRRVPLQPSEGDPTTFQGRPGFLNKAGNGTCTVFLVNGDPGVARIDYVSIRVKAPLQGADPCEQATNLANAAVTRLPQSN